MTRPSRLTVAFGTLGVVLAPALLAPALAQAAPTSDAAVQRALEQLVRAKGGPHGAIATLHRDGHLTVLRAGRADAKIPGAPTATEHMRIASITKAFSGAVALHLVQEGRVGLDNMIGRLLPDLPRSWAPGRHDLPQPSGAWASGAIVSTPTDLGAFIRADLGLKFFGAAQQQQQMRFVRGSSSPAGPGANAAGLGLFRYTTRCGTVYGHTGNFPGYTQFAAATANGSRSITTTLNIPAPTGKLLTLLRAAQAKAVCALLGR